MANKNVPYWAELSLPLVVDREFLLGCNSSGRISIAPQSSIKRSYKILYCYGGIKPRFNKTLSIT